MSPLVIISQPCPFFKPAIFGIEGLMNPLLDGADADRYRKSPLKLRIMNTPEIKTNELKLKRTRNGWTLGYSYSDPDYVFTDVDDLRNWIEEEFNYDAYYIKPEPQTDDI